MASAPRVECGCLYPVYYVETQNVADAIHPIRLIRFLSCCASILMKISVKKCNIIEIGTKVT